MQGSARLCVRRGLRRARLGSLAIVCLTVCLAMVMRPAMAAGQTSTASIQGTVTDQTGALPGATIVAREQQSGFEYTAISDGTVRAWGQNVYGNCGTGEVTNYTLVPTQVLNLNGVERISAGGTHALALRNDGTVWGWGDASLGQVGHGVVTSVQVTIPVPVSTLTGVVAVSAGVVMTLLLGFKAEFHAAMQRLERHELLATLQLLALAAVLLPLRLTVISAAGPPSLPE